MKEHLQIIRYYCNNIFIRYFYEIKVLLRKQFAVIVLIITFKREGTETSLSSVALATPQQCERVGQWDVMF